MRYIAVLRCYGVPGVRQTAIVRHPRSDLPDVKGQVRERIVSPPLVSSRDGTHRSRSKGRCDRAPFACNSKKYNPRGSALTSQE